MQGLPLKISRRNSSISRWQPIDGFHGRPQYLEADFVARFQHFAYDERSIQRGDQLRTMPVSLLVTAGRTTRRARRRSWF